MPLRSKAQARWMFANHPAMAEEWAHETPGGIKSLPAKVKTPRKKSGTFVPLRKMKGM